MKLDLQNRTPKVEILPDQRLRVTRLYDVLNFVGKTPAEIMANVKLSWGTADITYANCLLIKQDLDGQEGDSKTPCAEPPKLVRVYEQISPTAETQVGNAEVDIGQDGLYIIVENFLQFLGQTPLYGVPGTTTAAAPWTTAVLKTDERTDDGTLQRIKRTYTTKGQISLTQEIKENGSLLIQTLVYVNQVPPTPSGYVVFSQKTDYVNGLPVYTYSFAKGNGLISTLVEYLRSVDSGTTGVTKTTKKYLSASSVGTNPITQPGGTALLENEFEDQDGYRIWTMIYASGTGTVESSIEYRYDGLLVIYSITALTTPPTAPSPTIGGTVVLIKSSQRNSPRLEEGAIVYDYVWAEGLGLISQDITSRDDGLRDQTYIALGVRQAPTGVIIKDESENIDGVIKYTVVARQSSTGGSPTAESFTFQRYHPFTYPGRLKTYIATGSASRALDVYKSPPAQIDVLATVTVSYQTSNAIGSLAATFWNPLDGATVLGQWVGLNNFAQNLAESWRDYRSVSNTPVSFTSSGVAPNDSIFGNLAYGSTVASAQAYGGPPSPDGNTYTIAPPQLHFAFQDTSGTKYYRLTLVTATIPTQTALPV